MTRKIIVEFEVEPTDYNGAADTDAGAVNLAMAMLNREADLPIETVRVTCGRVTQPHTYETLH